jgi:HTH-type transcriptional regulator, sugar sensing transcriptional regulator
LSHADPLAWWYHSHPFERRNTHLVGNYYILLPPFFMAKDLLHILSSVGLSEGEAQLYLAGLQMGSGPASEYAKKTGINRITAYTMLEDLVKRGQFSVEKKMRAKWYVPVAPEEMSVEARKNADALERSLPELRSLRGSHYRKPHVRFFDGWDGVRRVYEDTLTAQSEILNFANSAVVRAFWPSYDEDYVAQRVKRKIRLRGIAPDDQVGRHVQGEDKKRLREIRLVPGKEFDFTNEINIYDHKVAICSFPDTAKKANQNVFGIIIESKEVADTQKQIFEMAWRFASGSSKKGGFFSR